MRRPNGTTEAVTSGYAGLGFFIFGIFYFFYRKMWIESALWAIIVLYPFFIIPANRNDGDPVDLLKLIGVQFLMSLIIGRLIRWHYRRKGWKYLGRDTYYTDLSPPAQGILMRRPDGREEYITTGHAGAAFILFGIFYFFYHRMWIESALWAIIVLTSFVLIRYDDLYSPDLYSFGVESVWILMSVRFFMSFVIIGRLIRWHYHRKGWTYIDEGNYGLYSLVDELRSGVVGWFRKE